MEQTFQSSEEGVMLLSDTPGLPYIANVMQKSASSPFHRFCEKTVQPNSLIERERLSVSAHLTR